MHSQETVFPMSIGNLSAASGCSPETIRYYEKQGLLPVAPRTPGGHRMYDEAQYKLLIFILRARQLGFSQPDVRRLMLMANPVRTNCEVVHDLAIHQLQSVRSKLKALRRLERTLNELITECESGGGRYACPMIESMLGESWISDKDSQAKAQSKGE